jgi:glycosyltransferase involved in cell wall biosynthesis
LEKRVKVLVIGSYHVIHTSRPEAEIIIGLAKMGLDMTVMTHAGTEYAERFAAHGVRVIPFHPEKKFKRKESQFIRNELIDGNYDILQLYTSKAIINGIRAARGLKVKVVLYRGYAGHIHWYDPAAYLKYLHPRVDKIICNSVGVEQYLARQLTMKENKLITINKGHDLSWYKNVALADLNKLGIPPYGFVVTCMANVRPMKGIPYLIKSMRWIPDNLPIYLVIGGDDSDAPQFKKLASQASDPSKIHLLGHRNDALSIVAASNVFALASIKGESITRAVQEAMALGIVPVITNIPGNKELVEHEVSGLVVPKRNPKAIAEAILRLYHHADLYRKLSAGAQHHIETKLSHQRTVMQMKTFYESLV